VSELIAFVFRDQYRAPEVLNELRRRDWPWVRDLDDAVAITINQNGKARAHLNIDLSTCEATRWARLWGSLLNTTLFLPLAELMIDAADGVSEQRSRTRTLGDRSDQSVEASWWKDALDHSKNFKRDVAASLVPNGSAIFALLRHSDAGKTLRELRNYGDTIVHTTIGESQDAKMNEFLQRH
jgi:uncharacterized membrane protein